MIDFAMQQAGQSYKSSNHSSMQATNNGDQKTSAAANGSEHILASASSSEEILPLQSDAKGNEAKSILNDLTITYKAKLDEQTEYITELEGHLATAEKTINEQGLSIEKLGDSKNKYKEKLKNTNKEKADQNRLLAETQNEVARLEHEVEIRNKERIDQDRLLAEIQSQVTSLQQEVERKNKEKDDQDRLLSETQNQVASLQKELAFLGRTIEGITDDAKCKLGQATSSSVANNSKRDTYRQLGEKWNGRLADAEAEKARLEGENSESEEEASDSDETGSEV